MRNLIKVFVLALTLALGLSIGSPVEARETYHGFVKDQYYLVQGGTPATLEQVASDPLEVFRSQLAYDNLRAHIGAMIGQPLSDSDFRSLIVSDDVRLIPCVGSVDTSGVTDTGRFGFHKRKCYRGEMLIQVRLQDGRWLTVASQGCYNPVRGEVPSLPPAAVDEQPAQPFVVSYRMKRGAEVVTPGPALNVGGNVVEVFVCPPDCVCEGGRIISTPRITTGGFPTTSGIFEN